MRRLPVYMLIDCSESMAGEPLEAVEAGIASMLMALRKDPHAIEMAYMSFITFDAKARLLLPLTEVSAITPPHLSIRPGTSLGEALTLLSDRIRSEVVRTTVESKGDFRPLVFILTDGQPTDEWQLPTQKLKEVKPRIANLYGIGCGDEVDFSILGSIADVCIHMRELSSESFAKFFVWMSASVQSMSVGVGDRLSLEKVPLDKGMNIIVPGQGSLPMPEKQRLFFHSKCQKTNKYYLMRYIRYRGEDVFHAFGSCPLPDDFFVDGEMKTPEVSTDMLSGVAECPYCGNDGWAHCGNCKRLFCDPPQSVEPVVCPHCGASLTMSGNGSAFGIQSSLG